MAGPDERVEPHVGRIENRTDGGNDSHVVAEHREVADALGLGAHHRKRGGWRGGFKADSEEHDVLVGIEPGQLQRIGRRIYDPNIHASGLMLKRTALGSRDAHHVAESGEDNIWFLADGKAIVDSSHGKHADRAARTVDQFDVFRKYIFQPEAIDGMGMSAADFHHAVVAFTGKAANFVCRLRNQFGFAELIDESHGDPSLAGWTRSSVNSRPPVRTLSLPASPRRSLPAS